jgi:hypothetical protein
MDTLVKIKINLWNQGSRWTKERSLQKFAERSRRKDNTKKMFPLTKCLTLIAEPDFPSRRK